jgi:hypothetical protein
MSIKIKTKKGLKFESFFSYISVESKKFELVEFFALAPRPTNHQPLFCVVIVIDNKAKKKGKPL